MSGPISASPIVTIEEMTISIRCGLGTIPGSHTYVIGPTAASLLTQQCTFVWRFRFLIVLLPLPELLLLLFTELLVFFLLVKTKFYTCRAN